MNEQTQSQRRVDRVIAAHPWLSQGRAWRLLAVKYKMMGSEQTIHNPEHLQLIMQSWADHLMEMDDASLRYLSDLMERVHEDHQREQHDTFDL